MIPKTAVVMSMTLVVALMLASRSGSTAAAGAPRIYVAYSAANSPLGAIPGRGGSGVQVQNLDPSLDAQVVADFYKQDGSAPVTINRPNLAAGSAGNFYFPTEQGLSNGVYAGVVSADRPIAAIVRTDWYSSGGSAIYGNLLPGQEVFAPLVAKGYGGQASYVTIQNTDTNQPTEVSIAFRSAGVSGGMVMATKTISRGTSVTVDLERDPDFAAVPRGALGSMVVRSAGAPVALQVFTDTGNHKAIHAYEGLPLESAATRLYAPLIRNDLAGTTGISVVNPGDASVDVTVTYTASPLTPACRGQVTHGGRSFALAAKGHLVFYQGNIAGLPTGDSGLPRRCVGSAVIEAVGGPVVAVVVDADLVRTANSVGAGTAAAYNAFSDADGALKVALPLYRKQHTNLQLSTGIQVMNIGASPANAVLAIKDHQGRALTVGPDARRTIPPLSAYTWIPASIPSLPAGGYGSATLTSDQPLAVIVNDASSNGAWDAAIYSGIKAD